MGKRIISIILALIIMISMASSVFAYTNLNNTESINLTLNNANDYNVLPSDGKYKEPTNSFDDNVTNGYYLVTQDGTKSELKEVVFNGKTYPINGVLVGDDLDTLKIPGDGYAIGDYRSKNNVTLFFDEGTYTEKGNPANYTDLSKENISYVGLEKGKVIFKKSFYADTITGDHAGTIERYNWMHKNIYIENIIFDGQGRDMAPLGGTHRLGNSTLGKNRGEYYFFITGVVAPFDGTSGMVMKNVTIQNVGKDTTEPYPLSQAARQRKNMAINFFKSVGDHHFENLTIKNIKTKPNYGIVSINQAKDIYFKNLEIDTTDAHETVRAFKVEHNALDVIGTVDKEFVVIDGLTTPEINGAKEAVFIQDYRYNSVFLSENYRFALYRNANGSTGAYPFAVPAGMIFENYELTGNLYERNYALYDRADNMWIVREGAVDRGGAAVSVTDQIGYVIDVFYKSNENSNDNKNTPLPKIKLIVQDNDIDGFDIKNYANLTTPVEIVAVKSIEDNVTSTGEAVQIPVKADATFNFALANADVKLYNFDFHTAAKYTYHQAVKGIAGDVDPQDPQEAGPIANYPKYDTYKTTQTPKITSPTRGISEANFGNARFTDLAKTIVSPVGDSEVKVGATLDLKATIGDSYTGDIGGTSADDPQIVYYSTDTSIATVSATGVVTGVKKGVVTIIAKAIDSNNEGEIEKPWKIWQITVSESIAPYIPKAIFKLVEGVEFNDGTTLPKVIPSNIVTKLLSGSVPTVRTVEDERYIYTFKGWVADRDVEIEGIIIPAGTILTPEQIAKVLMDRDVVYTAVVEYEEKFIEKDIVPNYPVDWLLFGAFETGGIEDPIEDEFHIKYVKGYPNGKFMPDGSITRGEVAMIFARISKESMIKDHIYHSNFTDIKEGEWYYDAIGFMVGKGILKGYPDGSFEPNKPITRAEFAAIATRFDGRILNLEEGITLTDLDKNYWAYESIIQSQRNGWVLGYPDREFKPLNEITRAEAVTITNRILARLADEKYVDSHLHELVKYSDIENHWAYYGIHEASNSHYYKYNSDHSETWYSIIEDGSI